MISARTFYEVLVQESITHFIGVPDSLLKSFSSHLLQLEHASHIIPANEGSALSLAAGYHLATGKIPLVYLQNSGFGNLVNPLNSLMSPEVYAIPSLVLMGWRGHPDFSDEPQHRTQGGTQVEQLRALGLSFTVLDMNKHTIHECIKNAVLQTRTSSSPHFLLAPPKLFKSDLTDLSRDSMKAENNHQKEIPADMCSPNYPLREQVLQVLIEHSTRKDIWVTTTGKTSREWFELRAVYGGNHEQDFLTVGSMGHASQIALGIALEKNRTPIFCIDGDGALIMHLGALATIGQQAPENFKHVVINNGAHESVGGQPTAGFVIDIPAIAKACGYTFATCVDSIKALKDVLPAFRNEDGPSLLEVRTCIGARPNLGRPKQNPIEAKRALMQFLAKNDD